jgi:hypothetical protein
MTIKAILPYLTALVMSLGAFEPAGAQEPSGLVSCPILTSSDQRLIMQQWAPDGTCRRPTRTRVIDRFLGYSCLEAKPGNAKCRSHVPGPDSRALDTSTHYRCVGVDVTASPEGVTVTHMREWVVAEPKACDWEPPLNVLAAEVDFATSQVCVAALCLPVARLSAIGRLRLRRTVEQAFRDLGVIPNDGEAKAAALRTGRVMKSLAPIAPVHSAVQR